MNVKTPLSVLALLVALPAFAAGGNPAGATAAADGAKPPYGRHGAMREACQADPEKCHRERMAQREKMCAQNPQQCQQMQARVEQRRAQCRADPEKCRQERQARADQHFRRADADGNGTLSRAEAGKGLPRLARHFDAIDTDRDGQLSRDELAAARKTYRGAKAPRKA